MTTWNATIIPHEHSRYHTMNSNCGTMNSRLLTRYGLAIVSIFTATICCLLATWSGRNSAAAAEDQLDRQAAEIFFATVRENFSKWDTDNSGVLSPAELARDVEDPRIKENAAAAVAAIRVLQREIAKNTGTTRNFHLQDFAAYESASDSGESSERKKLIHNFITFRKKIQRESRQFFAQEIPHLNSLHQGKSGDCYFASCVGGLVNTNPQAIVQMISENPDGSYTVAFLRRRPELVAPPSDGEVAEYSDAAGDGIWLHVLEKAYSQIQQRAQRGRFATRC